MQTKWLGPLAGTLLMLGGCFGFGVIIHEPVGGQNIADGDFDYAARNGEVRTAVFGNPFGAPTGGFTATVTRNMRGANPGKPVAFTPRPTGGGSGAYHVVMLFNPDRAATANDACANASNVPTAPGHDPVNLFSAFCIGDTPLSSAGGLANGVSSPEDQNFRELVQQVTQALFPIYDHFDIGGEGGSAPKM